MKYILSILSIFLISGLTVGAFARADQESHKKEKTELASAKQEESESEEEIPSGSAKITLPEATQTALSRVPGTVQKAELDDEEGALVYEVAIVGADHSRTEVKVDAQSGQILKVGKGEGEEEHEEEHEG